MSREGGLDQESDRLRRAETLYHDMLARPTGEREAALAAACPDDPALVAEVRSLLDEPESAAGPLARPAVEMAARFVPPPETSLIGKRVGVFEVHELLGAGGMGEVYRARDTRLGRDVALKALPPHLADDAERLARFRREARVLASLNHPNIAAIYGVEEAEGRMFLALELVEGEDLSARIARGAVPLADALPIARQIAEAMEAAHERGVIHRDLKPANIKVRPDGTVKVLDFGLAKAMDSSDVSGDPTGSPTLTGRASKVGLILGTAAYMAPEQALGKTVDRRADIWSFGVVLYEMLAGNRLFKGDDVASTLASVLRDSPSLDSLPVSVPPRVRRLLERCLDRDPRMRLRDIGEARVEIATIEAVGSRAEGHRPSRMWPGTLLPVSLLVASIAILATGYWLVLRPETGTRQPPPVWAPITFAKGFVHNARFVGDGESIVYSAAWGDRPVETYSTTRSSPESQRLEGPPAGLLAVSRSGELALSLKCHYLLGSGLCRGTLARGPLLGGAARQLASDVLAADWGPGGELAVVRSVGDKAYVEFPLGTRISRPSARRVRFSTHGDRLAWSTSSEVFVSDGRESRLWSEKWEFLSGLAWAEGDRALLVSGVRPGCNGCVMRIAPNEPDRIVLTGPGYLRILDAATDGALLVDSPRESIAMLVTKGFSVPPVSIDWFDGSIPDALSRDGETVLFTERWTASIGRTDLYPIYIRRINGGTTTRVGTGYGLDLSPDGRWALTRTRPSLGLPQLALLPLGPGSLRALDLGDVRLGDFAGWFVNDHRVVFPGAQAGGPPRTFVQSTESGLPSLVSHEPGVVASPVAPDGNRFVSRRDDGSLWLARLDGGESLRLPIKPTGDAVAFQWGQDRRALLVSSIDGGYVTVERIDVGRGAKTIVRRERWPLGANVFFAVTRAARDGAVLVFGGSQRLSTTYVVTGVK